MAESRIASLDTFAFQYLEALKFDEYFRVVKNAEEKAKTKSATVTGIHQIPPK